MAQYWGMTDRVLQRQERRSLDTEDTPRSGSLTVICGCMFSGKTAELLQRIRREPPGTVAVFKHGRDNRYRPSRVVTHAGDSWAATMVWRAVEIPAGLSEAHRLVAIDEGHFFDGELPEVCVQVAGSGRRVLVAALDLNSWGRPFPCIERLRRLANAELRKTTRCGRCGRTADHTQRLVPIIGGNIVGGPEAFEPRCRQCWSPPPEEPVD